MKAHFTTLLTVLLLAARPTAVAMPFFRHFTTEDGLPNPAVMSVCQDSLGRIWFGTEDGLGLYDGNGILSFTPYDKGADETHFRDGLVRKIVCDANGDIFFLTSYELVRRDCRTDRMEILMEGPITALYIDGGSACAIRGREVFRYDRISRTMRESDVLPFQGVKDVLRSSRSNTLFLICPEGLFCSEAPASWKKILPAGDLFSLFESREGEIWTGSNTDGLFRLAADGRIKHYHTKTDKDRGFKIDNIRAVVQDRSGRIWFGSFKGLYCYDSGTDSFRSWQREDREGGMSGSSVHSLMIDRDGILWAGTYYGGVNYTDTRDGAYSFFPATTADAEGLSYPVVGHLMEDTDGLIWICTEGGGLNCLNPADGTIRRYGTGAFSNAKWLASFPERSLLFIATNRQGLFCLNTNSQRLTRIIAPGGEKSPFYVINVVERHNDQLILSTDDGVWMHSLSSGKDTLLYPRKGDVRYVHIALHGKKLLLASANVVEFDLEKKKLVGEYPVEADEGRARPMRLFISPDGTVYTSTFGYGIFRLENGVFKRLDLPLYNGYQITSAGDGRLLISGGKEILLTDMDCRTLQSYIIGKSLPLEALVRDSGLLYSKDGTLYAGGTNGLVAFHPDIRDQQERDSLYLSRLKINGEILRTSHSIPFTKEIKLQGPQKRLDLTLSARHNAGAQNWTDYEFRLKGRDKSWTEMEDASVSLLKVRVGSYTFQVRHKGDIIPLFQTIITVRPLWYASPLALIAYSLLFAALVFYLLRSLRRRRIMARKAQIYDTKMQLLTTASQELRTPLSIIIAQIDSIFQTFRLAPQLRSRMKKVRNQASDMSRLINGFIDYRRIEQGQIYLAVSLQPVNPFVSDITDKFRELAQSKDITIRFIPSSQEPKAWIDGAQMQKALMNFVFNALMSTQRGETVDLEVCTEEERVVIHVKDRGTKQSTPNELRGFDIGLALAWHIVELHHGVVTVQPRDDGGNDYSISLSKNRIVFEGDENATVEEAEPLVLNPVNPDLKIVIAEDNPEMLELLKDLFSTQYQVFPATNGAKALELVLSVHPDLVLSDYTLPEMGGDELCAAIKKDARLAPIPVVLLTATDDNRTKMEGLLRGAEDMVVKPFDSRLLLARCNNIVRFRQYSSGSAANEKLSIMATDAEEKGFLEKVSAIIEQNIGNANLDIDSLASMMNMSRTAFYSRFKAITSESPGQYILSVRLKRSCELLDTRKDMSIGDIADSLGFNSQNYFCRRFKNRFGIPPLQYRNRNHSQENV